MTGVKQIESQTGERPRELPVVSAKAGQPFAKEDDIKTKQARLEQVIKSLGGAASKVQKEDDPVFSLVTNNRVQVSERPDENQAQQLADDLLSKLASPPPFCLVKSVDELRSIFPGLAQDGLGVTLIPKGFFYRGIVHVYALAITGRADFARTVWHELTHDDLRRYLS